MLGISIGLNSLSEHGACTAIFVAVACIVGFALASIQTLDKISWIAWVGLAGILSASKWLPLALLGGKCGSNMHQSSPLPSLSVSRIAPPLHPSLVLGSPISSSLRAPLLPKRLLLFPVWCSPTPVPLRTSTLCLR